MKKSVSLSYGIVVVIELAVSPTSIATNNIIVEILQTNQEEI